MMEKSNTINLTESDGRDGRSSSLRDIISQFRTARAEAPTSSSMPTSSPKQTLKDMFSSIKKSKSDDAPQQNTGFKIEKEEPRPLAKSQPISLLSSVIQEEKKQNETNQRYRK
jgi:hypothetical protein